MEEDPETWGTVTPFPSSWGVDGNSCHVSVLLRVLAWLSADTRHLQSVLSRRQILLCSLQTHQSPRDLAAAPLGLD